MRAASSLSAGWTRYVLEQRYGQRTTIAGGPLLVLHRGVPPGGDDEGRAGRSSDDRQLVLALVRLLALRAVLVLLVRAYPLQVPEALQRRGVRGDDDEADEAAAQLLPLVGPSSAGLSLTGAF